VEGAQILQIRCIGISGHLSGITKKEIQHICIILKEI
jgi:hypothetical protein